MKIPFRLLLPLSAALILSCSGCASRPDEQIQLATEAYNQAAEQYAEQYAPSEWKSAREAWDQAQEDLKNERWGPAATSFTTARARLEKARDVAKEERESMKKQVSDMQENITASYEAFKADAASARLSGSAKKEYEAACAEIDQRIELVADQMEKGDFIGAKENALGALQAIDYTAKKLLPGRTRGR